MAQSQLTKQLVQLIADLQAERQQHEDAIADIDAALGHFGIVTEAPARRGRRPGRKKVAKRRTAKKKTSKKKAGTKKGRRRRGRGAYSQTADEFVLGLLKGKTLTTKQVNDAWTRARRAGKADNTLSKLSKDKKVKRQNIKGARGSQYTAA